MRLYLVQHGEAKPADVDPTRSLTDKGLEDVRKVAAFLKSRRLAVEAVWHSGKTRAAETAEVLSQVISSNQGVLQREGLAPNDPVATVAEYLTTFTDDLVIVGHLPYLGKLVSVLVTGSEAANIASFQMGGVVCLERDEAGAWRVRWMVTPDLLD
ncbi:MAG: phosphohistidine phosphatase SixA [Desulfomonile sp.]|nr:phosphohistidine phosphatase SixA [Desulfomonile sp.]